MVLFRLFASAALGALLASGRTVTSVAELRALGAETAKLRLPVRIEGQLMQYSPHLYYAALENDGLGVYVLSPPGAASGGVGEGDWVVVEGATGQGQFAPVILARSLRALKKSLPLRALDVSLVDLVSSQYENRLVRVRGRVEEICRELAERLGGSPGARSEPGKGSCF